MDEVATSIIPILQQYGVKKASLFGSYAKNEDTISSDIDALIELPENMSLFKFALLKDDLEIKLNKPVDLVTYNSLHPMLKNKILATQKPIL